MAIDPYLSALLDPMPDELRPHLTGLVAEEHRPTHGPAAVFRLRGRQDKGMYLKVLDARDPGSGSLRDEAARLEWLGGRLPVPKVIAGGHEFLLTEALLGSPAHDRPTGRTGQETASLMGRALREFHSVPTADCPFRHPAVGPTDKEDEVLVHGDYCLPNVLFGSAGHHYLDVGEAGVGDRYIDLVAGIWSLRHNYGEGGAEYLLKEYGLPTPDREKLAAYRRWWNSL